MSNLKKVGFWVPLVAVIAGGLWPIVTDSAANREVFFTVLLAITLASSLNILLGYTGYVSFGHIVFYGLGAYVGFYLISVHGVSLPLAMLAGGLVPAVTAYLLGKAILRLRGAYFALATIGINEAARAFIRNFDPFGGPVGMQLNFSIYKQYGGASQALWTIYYLTLGLTLLVLVVSYFVRSSKFGLGLMAIRENEDAAEVMGVNAPDAKTWAFVISAIFPGIMGVLFFFKNGNILPGDAFRLHFSIEMIVMVMLGGAGLVIGPVLGGAVYQRLRGTLLVTPMFRNYQLVVAGVMLLVIILFVPEGVIGWIRRRFPRTRRVLE
ncbi:MAG: branched-chain amino acid ABC transporter permease [Anaerolineales bacterium]